MSEWTRDQLEAITQGRWIIVPTRDAVPFAGVAIDSRELYADQFFIAFVGEHVDGHAYLQAAAQRGASLCIVTDATRVPNGFQIPVLVVDDALVALTVLGQAWRQRLDTKVIAITGSNGKTTTCRLVQSVCAQAGKASGSTKSFNNALGVPITILNTPIDADYLVAELGTSSPGEIAQRAALVQPDIAIITSIGSAHLEQLGDRVGVAKEKTSIIRALKPNGTAIIPNGINELDAALVGIDPSINQSINLIRFGPTDDEPHCVHITSSTLTHTHFTLDHEPFAVPMLGAHNASNAAIAVLVGRDIGMNDDAIRAGLLSATPPKMRLDRIEITTSSDPIIVYNDAYNANPDSMRAALSTFDQLTIDMPKIAILGEMLELGSHAKTQHQQLLSQLDEYATITRFILVGAAFSQFESDIDPSRITIIPNTTDESMQRIASMITPGSCALLKGSRGNRLERIVQSFTQHPKEHTNLHTHA